MPSSEWRRDLSDEEFDEKYLPNARILYEKEREIYQLREQIKCAFIDKEQAEFRAWLDKWLYD